MARGTLAGSHSYSFLEWYGKKYLHQNETFFASGGLFELAAGELGKCLANGN
jgi:hypothetical protein